MNYRNVIFNEDCLVTMKRMKEEGVKVDLIVTSPPYNTGRDLKSERARNNHEGGYDSFMGTGTTAIGALRENCFYIGSELSKPQCDYAEKRIKLETSQLTLF